MNPLGKKALHVLKLGMVLLIVAPALRLTLSASTIPQGNGQQSVDLGGVSLQVFTYRPKRCTTAKMLLVFHGLHRNVDSYRDDLRPIANELCMLEVVPLFDEQRFPSWRYQKGGVAHQGHVLPADAWTGSLVIRLVEWVREQEAKPQMPYVAVGHSAGAQFLSRFAAFTPNEARGIFIANPSTHVLASMDVEAPFGFKGIYQAEQAESAMRTYLAQPVVMVLGQDDVGDKDRDDQPAAVAQGETRYDRGMNTFRSAKAEAQRRGWPFRWQLIELKGIGHSAGEVYGSRQVKEMLKAVADSTISANVQAPQEPRASLAHITLASFSWDTPPDLADAAVNEGTSPQSSSQNNPTQEPSPPKQSTKPQEPGQSEEPAQSGEKDDEVKITPHEAEELFHSVDEILEFDSKQTGLPIRKQVKRRLTSRDEVVSYLTKHMNDDDAQRLRRSELVLKKFGLLPRDFELEKLLVALLREQVAGYYDPKTKTVNLLDWVPLEQQEPVMAHELTHALQDQTVNLDRWMKKGDKDLAEIHKEITPADIENDEIDDAREAVVEGQAEAVMLQYALAPVGRSIIDSPELVESMESEMDNGSADSKVFKEAPIFLKESLTFPYNYGLAFVVKLMQKGGREKAFADVLHDPPHTTRQIMEPETYMTGEKIEPMRVPEFKRDFKDYEKFDIGAMGEFDVAVLVEQYAGKQLSKRMYPEWRGGYYYAARPKNNTNGPLGLLYVSRWSNAEKAGEFADIYARSLKDRYKKVIELEGAGDSLVVKADESKQVPPEQASSNQPASDQSEADSDQSTREKESFKVNVLKGRHVWQTNEGTVVIEEQGDTVLVSESLDAATTTTLEKEVFAK